MEILHNMLKTVRNTMERWSRAKRSMKLRDKFESHPTEALEFLDIELQIRDERISIPLDLINKFFSILVPLTAILVSVQAGLTTLFTVAAEHASVGSKQIEDTVGQMAKTIEHSGMSLWNLTWKTLIGLALISVGLMWYKTKIRRDLLVIHKILTQRAVSVGKSVQSANASETNAPIPHTSAPSDAVVSPS